MPISFYNGYRFDTKAEINEHGTNCLSKAHSDIVKAREICYTYRVNHLGIFIDFPPWESDLNYYNATLAHKVNNDFAPKINAILGSIDHPRFGLIPTVITTKTIAKDEEILVDYEYPEEMITETKWYFDLKEKSKQENSQKGVP